MHPGQPHRGLKHDREQDTDLPFATPRQQAEHRRRRLKPESLAQLIPIIRRRYRVQQRMTDELAGNSRTPVQRLLER